MGQKFPAASMSPAWGAQACMPLAQEALEHAWFIRAIIKLLPFTVCVLPRGNLWICGSVDYESTGARFHLCDVKADALC